MSLRQALLEWPPVTDRFKTLPSWTPNQASSQSANTWSDAGFNKEKQSDLRNWRFQIGALEDCLPSSPNIQKAHKSVTNPYMGIFLVITKTKSNFSRRLLARHVCVTRIVFVHGELLNWKADGKSAHPKGTHTRGWLIIIVMGKYVDVGLIW